MNNQRVHSAYIMSTFTFDTCTSLYSNLRKVLKSEILVQNKQRQKKRNLMKNNRGGINPPRWTDNGQRRQK